MAQRFLAADIQTRSFAALVLDVIVSSRGVCEPRLGRCLRAPVRRRR
ncbi:MAG: hypothetical protein ACXVYU_15515 [Oryzihumus sp.]